MHLFSTNRSIFMAESHVVTALVTKRAEMAGLIEHHRKEMGRLAVDLAHLDATLKLFSPEILPPIMFRPPGRTWGQAVRWQRVSRAGGGRV